MADVSGITDVQVDSTSQTRLVTYGATVTVGDVLYLDTSDNEYKLADCETSVDTAKARGIAVVPGVDGGAGIICTGGKLTLVGSALTTGYVYVLSAAGKIAPSADLAGSDWTTVMGVASASTVLSINIYASGVQI